MRPELRLCLLVGLGGAVGAVLRYGCGVWVPDGDGFPWTTFAINVSGALVLALLPGLAWVRRSTAWTAALGPGLLGGYTTLSAYAEQARDLLADGRAAVAAAYLLGTLAACYAAVLLGSQWARRAEEPR